MSQKLYGRAVWTARLATGILAATQLTAPTAGSAADGAPFEPFWAKFKSAVAAKNVSLVAANSQFPVQMPYGATPIADAKDLEARFTEVFDGDADAVTCFGGEAPEQRDGRYEVACGMKDGDEEAGKPNVYSFELVKGVWKFAGFDNANE